MMAPSPSSRDTSRERPSSRPQVGGVEILASRSLGAVAAVRDAFHQLGFENLIASRPSHQRDLVCAMVAGRIIRPHTKLATTRW